MAQDQFVAQISIFPFNFPPAGWAFCNGQILAISQNTALFSLLGTQYGGNGTSNFALPDLQGRASISQGQGPALSPYSVGEQTGSSSVTLISNEIPAHAHNVNCFDDAGLNPGPGANILAASGADSRGNVLYNDGTVGGTVNMNAAQVLPAGGSQPHNNMSPYVTLNYCIALQGIFPARN